MNEASRDGLDVSLLTALPLAIALFGYDGRLLTVTGAYLDMLGLPADAMPPGISFLDAMRLAAWRGAFGPGDPEQQAHALAAGERTQPRQLRRRLPDGRALCWHFTALADGRRLVTLADQTALADHRTEADEALRQMMSVFEQLPIGVAVLDRELRLRFANQRFAALLGRPGDWLAPGTALTELSRRLRDADGDGELAGTWPPWLALARSVEADAPAPLLCLTDNGTLLEVTARSEPELGWLLTLAVTQADGEARRREALAGLILQGLPHGVCIYGPDRRVRMFNPAYADRLGNQVRLGDPFARSPFADAASSDDGPVRPQGRPVLRRCELSAGQWVDAWLMSLPDAGLLCLISEPAPPVPAGSATRRDAGPLDAGPLDAGPLAAMFESLPHGALLWDAERRLVARNPRAVELLELPADRLTPGRLHADVLADLAASGAFGTPEQTGERLRDLLGRDRSRTHLHRRKNAAGRALEVISTPLPDGGFVVTYSDITPHRRAEDGVRRADAAPTAGARFLATMSHELRTPLNAIIGYSEALAREAQEPADPARVDEFTRRAREFAGTINHAGHDLLELINNMIDVARIESGRFDLSAERIELPHLVATCVRQVSEAARQASVAITTEVASGLPVLHGDERRLRQTLLQLIGNAVKFTRAGGAVRIAASLAAEGDLLISVSDTGIGIDDADLERVFEPFFQVDSSLSRRAAGSGLGLYVCRALVAAHGGTLTLASRKLEGTTVTIRLPKSRLQN